MLSSGYHMSSTIKRLEFKEKFVEISEDLFKVIKKKDFFRLWLLKLI